MVSISTIGRANLDTLVDTIKSLNDSDRRQLIERMNATSMADQKAAAQHRRLDRVLASARDDNMKVAMKVALRGLRRVGLDIEKLAAASDPLSVINAAMDKAKLNLGERMQLKTVVANVGAID
jgi:hypothetical protein